MSVYLPDMAEAEKDSSLLRVVDGSELEIHTLQGWVLEKTYTEEEAVPALEEAPNPAYKGAFDEFGNPSSELQTISCSKTIVQSKTKFLLRMPPDVLEGLERQRANKAEDELKEHQEMLKEARTMFEKLEKSNRDLQESNRNYQGKIDDLQLKLKNQTQTLDATKKQVTLFQRFMTRVWAEVGNERLREVLRKEYPDNIPVEEQVTPNQMVKTLIEQLVSHAD